MSRRLGLIIGLNSGQDSTFRPLQFAETDARALAQWLVNARGGNWPASDVQVVIGSAVTKELVESLVAQLCLQIAAPGDLVFIYFAGHAYIEPGSGEGYLAGSNTIYGQPGTGIHLFNLVRQAMVPSRASQVLLMLDCFQSGNIWSSLRSSPFDYSPLLGPTLINGLQQTQGRLLYCSCRGNEQAPEVGEKQLGALMYRLIVGLSSMASSAAQEPVTLQKLHSLLSGKLHEQHLPQVYGLEPRPVVLVGEMSSPSGVTINGHPSQSQASSGMHDSMARQTDGYPPTATPASGSLPYQTGVATAPNTSGQLSLALLEQNRQQQCMNMLNQARQQVQMQQIDAALNILEQALQIAPTFVDGLTLKAQLLGSIGRFQEAMQVIDQLLQIDQNNALAWSMRAAVLTNMNRFQEALLAIDRAIALNPTDTEAQTIRATIQVNLARMPNAAPDAQPRFPAQSAPRDSAKSFLSGAGLQILALIAGSAGAFLPIAQPHLPIILSFLLESFALAVLCVTAARGAYHYGVGRFVLSLVLSLLTLGIIGGLYKFAYHWFLARIQAIPPLIVPVLFLAIWLIAAAVVPFLGALGGLIGGIVTGVRRKG